MMRCGVGPACEKDMHRRSETVKQARRASLGLGKMGQGIFWRSNELVNPNGPR